MNVLTLTLIEAAGAAEYRLAFYFLPSICQFYSPYLSSFSFSSLWLKSRLFLANTSQEQKKIYFRALSYKMIIMERLTKVVIFVGPLQRVRPKNVILAMVVVVIVVVGLGPLRSEFIGEL